MAKEKATTKLCKHCKTEIPAGAKVCPHCRKKQGGKLKIILIVIVVICIIGALAGGGDEDEPKKVDNQQDNKTTTTATSKGTSKSTESQEENTDNKAYTIGDTIDDNGLLITLVSCDEYVSENEFITPEEGNKYIKINFEIQNNSEKTENISSYVSFSAYADDYSIEQTYVDSSEKTLDGEVASGKKMNGSIFYEIPNDTKTLQVDYISNFWTDRRTTFVITF